MGAIRDYMFVSNRLTASSFDTSASLREIANDDIMPEPQFETASELPSMLNEQFSQKLNSVSIGPTGRIFKMVTSEQISQVNGLDAGDELSDGNDFADVGVSISPEFLSKGDIVVMDGGISTPGMFVGFENLQDDSEIEKIAL